VFAMSDYESCLYNHKSKFYDSGMKNLDENFFLNPGDTIGICAPAACFERERFARGINALETMGFKALIPDEIFERKRYLAGDDEKRACVVNSLFSDSGIDGIICARGGFGSMRILELIDWDGVCTSSKPFMGYSDNTALVVNIIQRAMIPVFHGPDVLYLADADDAMLSCVYDNLTGVLTPVHFDHAGVIRHGRAAGILTGGNLSTLSHLLGTGFQPDFKDAVVFLEDTGESAYRIDRMLSQMKMAGMFDGVRAVVTGSFENCSNDEYLDQILREIFMPYNVPVISGLASGHGKVNLPLLMGTQISIDTDRLTIEWI